jgi:PIN domain nuclease of toxin-antitoxin system
MRLLLDTHALLWWFTNDPRLSATARATIADADNDVYASAASAWEIATKHRIGKLTGLPAVTQRYADLIAADGFRHLAVTHLHALRPAPGRILTETPSTACSPPRARLRRCRW